MGNVNEMKDIGKNLIYESIEEYKRLADSKIFTIEYGLRNLLETISKDSYSIPSFRVCIAIKQDGNNAYLFKKSDADNENCQCIQFRLDITSATKVRWDNKDNLLYTIVSSHLDCDIEDLFIFSIYPNWINANVAPIERLCFLIIETKEYRKYQNLESFYKSFAENYKEAIVLDKYSYKTTEEIIDGAVKDIFVGDNSLTLPRRSAIPNFPLITELSSMLYEGSRCKAKMIVNDDTEPDIAFKEPCEFDKKNLRAVRKLLELVNADGEDDGQALLIKTYNEPDKVFPKFIIVGFVSEEKYQNNPAFIIEDSLIWRYEYKKKTLLCYYKGRYIVSKKDDYNKAMVQEKLLTLFADVNIELLIGIIDKAWEQRHGTTLLITDDAEDKIINLCNNGRGYQIDKYDLSKHTNMVRKMTAIDGAMVMNSDGNCYAIGVILDGEAIRNGSMAWGARYNSANNYIAILKEQKKNAVVIIISEDRTLDVISTGDTET